MSNTTTPTFTLTLGPNIVINNGSTVTVAGNIITQQSVNTDGGVAGLDNNGLLILNNIGVLGVDGNGHLFINYDALPQTENGFNPVAGSGVFYLNGGVVKVA